MVVKCFLGVIGSGKDYQCKKLLEYKYKQINFADPLREMAWNILNWRPASSLEYDIFKKKTINMFNYKTDLSDPVFSLTGREFLQYLGSYMRKLDDNFWVNLWAKEVLKYSKEYDICCSDLRYENELYKAQEINADIYYCNYISDRYEPNNPHESEKLAQSLIQIYKKPITKIKYRQKDGY